MFAGGDGNLLRPGGLCFDPLGRLVVASLDGCVHVYDGPGCPAPGLNHRVLVDMQCGSLGSVGRPWDVVCLSNGITYLTSHSLEKWGLTGGRRREELGGLHGVVKMSPEGDVLGTVTDHPNMYMPNMMCIEL